MIKQMNLYPKEKEQLQSMERQGYSVNGCNNWLCPFNNDGKCLDDVYNESLSDVLREKVRQIMVEKWGKKNAKAD